MSRGNRLIVLTGSVLVLGIAAFFVQQKFDAARSQELIWFRVASHDFKKVNELETVELEAVRTPGGVVAYRVRLKAPGERTRSSVFDLKHCLPSEEKIERNPPAGSAYSREPVRIKEALS